MNEALLKFYRRSPDVIAKRLVELVSGGGAAGTPPGGEAGQILRKVSGQSFDTAWTSDLGPEGPPGIQGPQGPQGPQGEPPPTPVLEPWIDCGTTNAQWEQIITVQARRFCYGQMTALRGQIATLAQRTLGSRTNTNIVLPLNHRPTQRFYRPITCVSNLGLRSYLEVEQGGGVWFHACELIPAGARFNLGIEYHSWGPTTRATRRAL